MDPTTCTQPAPGREMELRKVTKLVGYYHYYSSYRPGPSPVLTSYLLKLENYSDGRYEGPERAHSLQRSASQISFLQNFY